MSKEKTNLEIYAELQIDLIKCEEYVKIIENCRIKYKDCDLFKACVKKRLGNYVTFETLPEKW